VVTFLVRAIPLKDTMRKLISKKRPVGGWPKQD
jgi:hypothetical protein